MGLVPAVNATSTYVPEPPSDLTNYCQFICKVRLFSRWMYGILMALSVVFILYAAFLYLISQGSDERISTAKKVLIYAIVALVVGVLAGSIPALVESWGTDDVQKTGCETAKCWK